MMHSRALWSTQPLAAATLGENEAWGQRRSEPGACLLLEALPSGTRFPSAVGLLRERYSAVSPVSTTFSSARCARLGCCFFSTPLETVKQPHQATAAGRSMMRMSAARRTA
ncbi:hypothetical protein KFL_000700170 [Klebsormidium nitens]|uniref:Uncharacterized protein n=1 Tax=Klebsormidium nitens TaxID=105231 RepID=A0A1Y1HR32_KLENI|nr:hypothetical protein KFL_000700170 [Klebsormidium nitens]|eukprot:GAQ81080.1 hypothetical protein KFL_000700170 [Klebsormidium nitens]